MSLQPRGFTKSELKRRYYDLSKIYHPDKNDEPEAMEIFIKVKLAYDILGSEHKKLYYDLFFQTDFSEEDKIAEEFKQAFPDEKERNE